jgi:hypothetical protein
MDVLLAVFNKDGEQGCSPRRTIDRFLKTLDSTPDLFLLAFLLQFSQRRESALSLLFRNDDEGLLDSLSV